MFMVPIIGNATAWEFSTVAKANTTSTDDTTGKEVTAKAFTVRDIPDVMRNKLNWAVAADIMDIWFDSDSPWQITEELKYPTESGISYSTSGPYRINDGKIVTMDWANTFMNVILAKEELGKRVGFEIELQFQRPIISSFMLHTMNKASKGLLLKRLIKAGWVPPYDIKLADCIDKTDKAHGLYEKIENTNGTNKKKLTLFILVKASTKTQHSQSMNYYNLI